MRFAWLAVVVGASALVAACDPEPFTMVVTVRDTALVAYRDGDGEWKPVEPGLTGRARIRIESGRYSLAWACQSGSTQWTVIHSTIGDEPQAVCTESSNPIRVQLTGMASPFARIALGTQEVQSDSLGLYGANVAAGYYDVVALSVDPPRAMIQHDVDLTTSDELDLPVALLGADMLVVQPVITGTDQDITLTSELYTRNGTVVELQADGEMLPVVPSSQLVDGDYQIARVDGEGCISTTRIEGETPRVEVPDPPVPLIERRRFRWSSDLEWRYVSLDLRTGRGLTTISATRDWMDAQGTDDVEIPDFTMMPGFGIDLINLGPSDAVNWEFTAERGHRSSASASCTAGGNIENW